MKLINLLFLFIPVLGMSQVDTASIPGYLCFGCDSTEFTKRYNDFVIGDPNGNYKIVKGKLYKKELPKPELYKLPEVDTLPSYYNTSTEIAKGKVETPVNVMDSGLKVEVVETRDTVYECPYSAISLTYYVNTNGNKSLEPDHRNCVKKEVITTRRYKMYIINEYGQKEYLEMEITKKK